MDLGRRGFDVLLGWTTRITLNGKKETVVYLLCVCLSVCVCVCVFFCLIVPFQAHNVRNVQSTLFPFFASMFYMCVVYMLTALCMYVLYVCSVYVDCSLHVCFVCVFMLTVI